MKEIILETKELSKRYGGVIALDNVSLSFEKGLIHAIVGENGAGKSTLIRIISGIEPPTSGEVIFCGEKIKVFDPKLAHDLGISTVYQDPMQMEKMSIEENIYIGRYRKTKLGFVDFNDLRKRVQGLMDEIGLQMDTKATINTLSVAKRQMVEILKAVSFNSQLVIFDEPSASLTLEEFATLKRIIRRLKEKGITVIYISHRLEEIFDLCDTVTVLRDGREVGIRNVVDIDKDKLISMMVGRNMDNLFPKYDVEIGDTIFSVRGLTNEKIKKISFDLHKGEILGIAGLVGSGRTEIANALFGIDKAQGEMEVEEKTVIVRNPTDAIAQGIAMVPEDRKTQGLIPILSVRDNTTLSSLRQLTRGLLLDNKKERNLVGKYVDRLRIKTPSYDQLARNLSGGNQQKVVFAKWMCCEPKILILDEPTHGVDVGAKTEIYSLINDLAESGMGVIMISSEMTELIGLCDRILVIREGKVNKSLNRNMFSEDTIMQYAIEEVE